MFLKEAAITTLRASRNIYRQNMERFHNTTIAALTIATSTTNWIDRDEMNPNRDRNKPHEYKLSKTKRQARLLVPIASPKDERYL